MTVAASVPLGAAALALCLTACANPPSSPRPEQNLRLGNAAYHQADYETALVCFMSAAGQQPAEGLARLNIGDALYRLGRFAEAARAFELANSLTTDSEIKHAALHNLGNALVGTGRLDDAEQAYIWALALRPEAADTLYNLAWTRARIMERSRESAASSRDGANDRPKPSLTPQEERQLLAAAQEADLRGRGVLRRPAISANRVEKYW